MPRRHEHRVGSPRRTLRLLPHDPALLLRLRDPLPRGERVSVELAVDDIRQRHRPERPDIAHHALDPIRKRPARLSRVELSSMAAPVNVPIAPRVPFLFLVPTVPEVPFGNRRFRGVVHVEIHRFRPTVAAMMVATRHRPLVVLVTCPLWTYMECEIPPAPISHNSGLAFRPIRPRSTRYVLPFSHPLDPDGKRSGPERPPANRSICGPGGVFYFADRPPGGVAQVQLFPSGKGDKRGRNLAAVGSTPDPTSTTTPTRTYRTLPRATAAIHRAAAVLTENGVAGIVITTINYVAYSEDGLVQLATVKT